MNHSSSNPSRSPWTLRALVAAPLLFWPTFMLLTIWEERGGATWLHTENSMLWRPVAIAAIVLAVIAPLFLRTNAKRRIAASIGSLAAFAAIYGMVIMIGASFLNWGD